jgi:pilus assembly protein CpaE
MDSNVKIGSAGDPGQGTSPRLLACVSGTETQEAARALAAALGWRNPAVMSGGTAAARDYITKQAPPHLLIVDIDDVDDPLTALAELAEVCPPEITVIAVGSRNELTLYRNLIELGITDYLLKPVTLTMFERSLRSDAKRQLGQGTAKTQAHFVTFVGVRGGAGTTTVATSVAWSLSQIHQKRVLLIDLDFQFGNLALSLDLVPVPGFREALEHPSRLDGRLLSSTMLEANPRLKVLAAEEPLADNFHLGSGAIDALVNAVRHDYDFIIVDLPRVLSDENRRMLTLSGTIGLVSDLSLASARDLLRLSDFAKTMTSSARHMIVANHVGAKYRGDIPKGEFERITALTIDHVIPFEPNAALATSSTSTVLVAALNRSPAAAGLRRIATSLAGTEAANVRMGSILGKLVQLGAPRGFLPGFLKRSA